MSEPARDGRAQTLYCSFCGKGQHDVARLIAGPTVFICNECVDLCQDILAGRSPEAPPTPKITLVQQRGDAYAVKALADAPMIYRPDEDLTAELRAAADTGPVLSAGYVVLNRRDWDRLLLLTLGLRERRA